MSFANLPHTILDDGTFASGVVAGAPPFSIDGINVGFVNNTNLPQTFDVLVQFYDTVNYGVSNSSPVATTPLGQLFRIPVIAAPGGLPAQDPPGNSGETGLVPLSGTLPVIPDGNFGVTIEFVNTNTTTIDSNILPLFKNVPVTTGSSNNDFAADLNDDGNIVGSEILTFANAPNPGDPAANLYLAVDATAVPEPVAMPILLGGTAFAAMRRRKAVKI